ncbi:MAG: 16S rRNA (guanine(527)-N(7))-methyltransferase RsmG [Woeseia sp.]|nr:16S rRNA (guanine(527)-N(7))-methyltransferase RsmG [Woeseia sp.]|tara:strand:+ start:5291 stop:5929 length:639 start_codon:yes stop_codon:yes gene_type:complete
MIEESIAAGAAAQGQRLSDDIVTKLAALLSSLERWNDRVNLTAVRNIQDMIKLHILDSLSVRPFIQGPKVIDIGTGAGFPGLPLAIVEPDVDFVLLDSHGKKISFVTQMIVDLQLDNVKAVKERAEHYEPAFGFDTVMARAVTSIPRLLTLAGHLIGDTGHMLVLKGRYPVEELETIRSKGQWQASVSKLVVAGLDSHARHVISLKRKSSVS